MVERAVETDGPFVVSVNRAWRLVQDVGLMWKKVEGVSSGRWMGDVVERGEVMWWNARERSRVVGLACAAACG